TRSSARRCARRCDAGGRAVPLVERRAESHSRTFEYSGAPSGTPPMNEQRTRVKAPLIVLALFTSVGSVKAQLQLLPDPQPQQVFSGTARRISLLVSNASDKTATAEVFARLHQASSATTARLSDTPWKTL